MKKILFVAASLRIGGMERVLVDISNELVKRNYDVTILTYEDEKGPTWKCDLDERVHFIYKAPKPFKIMRSLPYFHRYYKGIKWETRTSARNLYRYYVGSKVKYDVEVAFCRGPAVKIISGSTNRKSVKLNWVHNDYKIINPKTITRFFRNMDEAKQAYKAFDRIAGVSKQATQNFIETIGYPEKTTTIYNMLDIDMINRKKAEPCPREKKTFTMISVARLIASKGYDTLLKAVKKLNDDGLDFELWLVGTDNMSEHEKMLRNYADDNQLDNVIFMGRQMNPYCYMAQADVYVCSSWREGFSISVAEATACGLPVISTRCTGPCEILNDGEYGVLVDYDVDALYEALKAAILNPDSLNEYREKSVKRSRDFSGEVIIEQIIELFNIKK